MKRDDEKDGLYCQAVSRFFLEHRGPPFYLSSREIEEIEEWKNMGIPLQTVLEGIKDCFAAHKRKPGRKAKIKSLAFCRPFVLRGYEAYKERKVGGQEKPFLEENKQKELRKAVEGFLASCPQKFAELRRIFLRVQESISCGIDEEVLENLENVAEALLIRMASEEEKKRIQEEVFSEFGTEDPRELDRIQKLKVIKHIRKKFGIPHISLYYY